MVARVRSDAQSYSFALGVVDAADGDLAVELSIVGGVGINWGSPYDVAIGAVDGSGGKTIVAVAY